MRTTSIARPNLLSVAGTPRIAALALSNPSLTVYARCVLCPTVEWRLW